ncbi:MAG: lysophospholipid acyltransferase family protein [Bryobacteraceae bacterium]|jgi:1-acyl-sn-glycerol-3-phosphate acyltransferase
MPLRRRNRREPQRSITRKVATSFGLTLLGIAAAALPVHFLLRRELRDAPEDIRSQGWPIRLVQVLFLKYVIRWLRVEGLENLPSGSYLVAANHGYKSGVDGFILGHLLATQARRVPRIVMTGEGRSLTVTVERWVLHHYGIALLVSDETGSRASRRRGLTDIIASYLRESNEHSVIIFPAGRATADPALQLQDWSTGVVVSAQKSGCPIVPVAIGGLPIGWTPETVLLSALHAEGAAPPFQIHLRIGKPITPVGEPSEALEQLRSAVADLMLSIPDLHPEPVKSDGALAT